MLPLIFSIPAILLIVLAMIEQDGIQKQTYLLYAIVVLIAGLHSKKKD